MSIIKKANQIIGNNLILRNATSADAEFILGLRTNPSKSRHLSSVPGDLSAQRVWLENYSGVNEQAYFIIAAQDTDVGTVRIYDGQGDSFCWGSWILSAGCPAFYGIESALIIYHYALKLGFLQSHFDVRKGNSSVWRFHERFGAVRVGENDMDFLYEISHSAIMESLKKYGKYLPNGIWVED